MLGLADGRVHLQARAEAKIVPAVEEEELRQGLARDEPVAASLSQERDLVGGAQVQDVEATLKPLGERDGPSGGQERRLHVTKPRVGGDVEAQSREARLILSKAGLILGVDRDRHAAALAEVGLEGGLIVHEQGARRAAHEDLQPTDEPGHVVDRRGVRGGRAEEEAKVGSAPTRGAGVLVEDGGAIDRGRLCVRHLEERRHPTARGGDAAGLEILFMGEPRLAKVDLRINHPRQERQPSPVDDLPGRPIDEADRGDEAVFDPKVPDIGRDPPGWDDLDFPKCEASRHEPALSDWQVFVKGVHDHARPSPLVRCHAQHPLH